MLSMQKALIVNEIGQPVILTNCAIPHPGREWSFYDAYAHPHYTIEM